MQAREFLKQAYRLDELINSNMIEIAQLEDLSTSIKSIDYSKDKISGGNADKSASYEKVIDKIMVLESKVNSEINELVDLKTKIREAICELKVPEEKVLLRLRYINFKQWEDICEQMHISERTAKRIHGQALQKLKVPKR